MINSDIDESTTILNVDNKKGNSIESSEKSTGNKTTIYWSPANEDEQVRLAGSHFAAKEVFGGNVQRQVADYVSFEEGIDCLHICCGAGAFLADMASEYPKSKFVGVDIDDVAEMISKLPNVSFFVGNVAEGLDLPDNSFDYIQMRLFTSILKKSEWPIALKEVYRLLKPGGCVGFLEIETRETGNENCRRVCRALTKLSESLEQEPRAGLKLKEWVVEAGLQHIVTDETFVDCGPNTGRAKRWRWYWAQTCTFMGPHLSEDLNVKLEDWPAYVDELIEHMRQSNGQVTILRCLARKPLNN